MKEKKNKKYIGKSKKNQAKALINKIINEVHKEGLVGEEDSILVLAIKIFLRLVQNASATSSNILVSDETGSGKDVLVKAVCTTLVPKQKYHHRTDISDKAFDYWQPTITWDKDDEKKPIKDSWDGHVIHLEDPRKEALMGQSFKVMASGGTHVTKVINNKSKDIEITGKPVIIVTSLNASVDEEGVRRWDSLRVDTSDRLTEMVINNYLKQIAGSGNLEKDHSLRQRIQSLKPAEVVIPFAEKLEKHIPSYLSMRTRLKRLGDYIKASAVLHQEFRETDEKGRIIATRFDYDYARFAFSSLKDFKGLALNVGEEEFIEFLKKQKYPLSIAEVEQRFGKKSKTWIYEHLDKFVSLGLIKVTYVKDDTNRNIRYIQYSGEQTQNQTLPPSQRLFSSSNSSVESQHQKDFKTSNIFYDILKHLDCQREEMGLPPIFNEYYSHLKESVETIKTSEENEFKQESENPVEEPEE